MYTYQAIKKRGRPSLYSETNQTLILKKEQLFENNNQKNIMDLANLAYNLKKISKEELDTASFVQSLAYKVEKNLCIKKIPSSAPHTWSTNIQNTYHNLNNNYSEEFKLWSKIKIQLSLNNIPANFLPLITNHYSYEELLALKNNFHLMTLIKNGLNVILSLINN